LPIWLNIAESRNYLEVAMADTMPSRPAFIPSVIYQDNRAALHWLQQAFGFEMSEVLTDSRDNIVHAEMTHGDGVVMIGSEFAAWVCSPRATGGRNTQRVHVRIERDIDAHCARARAAGAVIAMEPADQFYGDRTYIAVDPEGHHWSFAQSVRNVSRQEMEKATGLQYKALT
jgi:uncharacterized glyoxalase superfamily protein PhnB